MVSNRLASAGTNAVSAFLLGYAVARLRTREHPARTALRWGVLAGIVSYVVIGPVEREPIEERVPVEPSPTEAPATGATGD
jgi:hypothetical protein